MDLSNIKDAINGKKTYLIAFSSIIAVVIGWANKSIADQAALDQIIGLVLAMTIRHGVSNAVKKITDETNPAPLQNKPSNAFDDGIKVTLK